MNTQCFIKLLDPTTALVGSFTPEGNLWSVTLASTTPGVQPVSSVNDGLPSRRVVSLGGYEASTYVDLNLARFYAVKKDGVKVWGDSLR